MRDWQETAEDIVTEVRYYMDSYERHIEDKVREACDERVWETADSMCIYYNQCREYIEDLESQYGSYVEDYGTEYNIDQRHELEQCLAFQLVRACLTEHVETELEKLIDDEILIDV